MSVDIQFGEQENGGYWFTIMAYRGKMIVDPVNSWRRGTQKEIVAYHAARYVKRFGSGGTKSLTPIGNKKKMEKLKARPA